MKGRVESYNRMLQEMQEEERKGNLFLIAPEDTLGVGRTEGNWEKLKPLYEEGVETARRQMDKIKAYLEA